jgi:HK97 family phage major capsid protein/HK97 family phage prohead protease
LPERGSLARWKKGAGTLELSVDDTGVKFRFDCPDTPFGQEILDAIRRGDIDRCSFAFYTNEDDCTMVENEDGTYDRTVNSIRAIVEISLLDVAPAYEGTSVDNRNQSDNTMNEEKIKELDEQITALKSQLEELKNEEPEAGTPEEKSEEEPEAEKPEETPENPEAEKPEDETEEPASEEPVEQEEENKEENNRTKTMKKTQFSLLKAIRSVVNNGKLDNASQAISNIGAQEMRAAGLPVAGQIQIPMSERQGEITVTAEHDDVVVTEFTDILEPLRANNALADAGARIMTGLVGDLQVPIMNGGNCGWAGEIAAASPAGTSFDHILLQPKRLTAYIDISKQFIVQDSLGAEQMIRTDLVKALQDKLEATILGDAAGDTTKPAGIFNGVSATSVTDFGDITELEATVEEENFNGPFHYVVSPKAKAAMRSMIIGTTGPAGMVWQNSEVDGVPAECTTHMAQNTFAYGDWSQLVIGQWGAIDLTIDPYSQAVNGVVRITINAFFDAKLAREKAIALGTFA